MFGFQVEVLCRRGFEMLDVVSVIPGILCPEKKGAVGRQATAHRPLLGHGRGHSGDLQGLLLVGPVWAQKAK